MHAQTDPARPATDTAADDVTGQSSGEPDPRAAIEQAVAALDDLDAVAPAEHVRRFDDVHTALSAALSSIDKV
ncbi:hypothetical protein [Saccharomonospora saliphila]|uniref:hypothetical protein n=1 Tax=Saccharomonospora saliphila TaxID=369829 RepID=UPI0003792256|nr:hypothetical protein [Saccharomonospora saliphila]